MVVKIMTGKKLRGALHYNENKVAEGTATIILASSFAGDIDKMNFQQKLTRFENLMLLRPSVKTNTLHISLNFDATEKLDDEKMQRIAIAYMEKIGFGDQPFLAYRHNDVAHDHIHIVTTNIQPSGKAISLHNIGRDPSMKACREIETNFNLVPASSKGYKPEPGIKPVEIQAIRYGKIPTKRAISNTLNAVISSYKYTSLAELNAVLKQFNIVADRGAADSAMYQKRGLIYSQLDEQGNKVGIPIKASSLYAKPTLNNLEMEFSKHEERRLPFKQSLKDRLDKVLSTGRHTEQSYIAALKKQGVIAMFRRSESGMTYGITYVDHNTKSVFNGSDLGKNYSAKAITTQFRQDHTKRVAPMQGTANQPQNIKPVYIQNGSVNPFIALLKPDHDYDSPLPKRKRKKKKLSI